MLKQLAAIFRGRRSPNNSNNSNQSTDPRHQLGQRGELLAERFLKRQGYRRIARNERLPGGEIDLIMAGPRPDRTIVFIEVKTRTSDQVPGEHAINAPKRRRLIQLTQRIARKRGWDQRPLRIDVIVIVWPQTTQSDEKSALIRHHPNAVTL